MVFRSGSLGSCSTQWWMNKSWLDKTIQKMYELRNENVRRCDKSKRHCSKVFHHDFTSCCLHHPSHSPSEMGNLYQAGRPHKQSDGNSSSKPSELSGEFLSKCKVFKHSSQSLDLLIKFKYIHSNDVFNPCSINSIPGLGRIAGAKHYVMSLRRFWRTELLAGTKTPPNSRGTRSRAYSVQRSHKLVWHAGDPCFLMVIWQAEIGESIEN